MTAGEKQHGGADVAAPTQSAHGDALQQTLLARVTESLPLPFGVGVGTDKARRHAVDGDAEGSELVGQLPNQADLPRLGAGVGLDPGQADTQAGTTDFPE